MKFRFNTRQKLVGYMFVAPNVLGVTLFFLLPALYSFYLMFTDYSFLTKQSANFIGLENISRLMEDEAFHRSLKYTFIFLFTVPASIMVSFPIAFLLNAHVRMKKLLRSMYFLPYVMNGVAVAFVWMLLFEPNNGPINETLRMLGIANPPSWLASTTSSIYGVGIIHAWAMIGFNVIIYLAALQEVPSELMEASHIDGAKWWQTIRHVTLPLVSPTTFLLLVTGFIGAIKSFGIIQATTGGGPGDSTTVLSIFIYKTAFRYYDMGYASAASWALFTIILLIMVMNWLGQKRWVHY
ncbi:carbohydrate ABC transporter permease [Paenibacillus soyae]|uniref:Sugar ABC transporter permease n=1 Tax=Paenibacillus soyae TaxID=2969249 RepID=A0A9X2MSI7_9BACL|nr:sugar ABC transporter permease [Paenibacillus soyae]